MGRKSNMSAESAAVIAQLRKLGAQVEDDLAKAVPADTPAQLKKRLANLRDCRWIQAAPNADGVRMWSIRPAARPLFPETDNAPRKPRNSVNAAAEVLPSTNEAAIEPIVCEVATPRIVHVMQGEYCPPRASAARPGAHDFLAIPSQGVRC